MKMINDQGGINGRKINLIQYDDAYSPPKSGRAGAQAGRRATKCCSSSSCIGTPPNAAVQKYLNAKKVPQLFAATGASKFTDPEELPWTMGFNPELFRRGPHLRPVHHRRNIRTPRSGSSIRTTISARTTSTGMKAGLGDKAAKMIVAEASYEVSDPTIDSQMLKIRTPARTCSTSASTPKQAAQAIRKIARTQLEAGAHPRHQRQPRSAP